MKTLAQQVVTALAFSTFVLAGAAAHADSITGFGGDGTGWTLNHGGGGAGGAPPSISGDVLTLVNGFDTGNSVFYNAPVNISSFTASFLWQNTVPWDGFNPADGMVFTLQNAGPTAVGNGGGSLGFGGIAPATGIAFNLFPWNVVGFGYRGSPYQSTAPVDFDSTDPISVLLGYSNGQVNLSVQDMTTLASFSTSFAANIPADAGGTTAYVGFTGGAGAAQSYQTISDFRFTSNVPEAASTLALLATAVCGMACMRRKLHS